MKLPMKRLILIVAMCLLPTAALATDFAVTPAGAGTKSGADWNNACAGFTGACSSTNGAAMAGGNTIWVGGGTIASGNTAFTASHTGVITVRAATVANHGSLAGWTNALAASASTPVVLVSGFQFTGTGSSDGWTIEGDPAAGYCNPVNGCTFKVTNNVVGYNQWPINIHGASNITIAYIEYAGNGVFTYGEEHGSFSTVSCSANVLTVVGVNTKTSSPTTSGYTHWPYVGQPVLINGVVTQTSFNTGGTNAGYTKIASVTDATHYTIGGNGYTCTNGSDTTGQWQGYGTGQLEETVRAVNSDGPTTNIDFNGVYMHDMMSNPFVLRGGGPWTIEHCYITRSSGGTSGNHMEAISWNGISNFIIRYNVFEDIAGTGVISSVNQTGTTTGLYIYGNDFRQSVNNPSPYHIGATDTGVVSFNNTGTFNGVFVYNNTIRNLSGDGGPCTNAGIQWVDSVINGALVSRNNLFYGNNCNITIQGARTGLTVDNNYNAFLGTQGTINGNGNTNDKTDAAATNPFTGATDAHIVAGYSPAADVNFGQAQSNTLPSGCTAGTNCYDTDIFGVTRGGANGWTVGAAQQLSSTVAIAPSSLAFGTVAVNTTSSGEAISVTNNSGATITASGDSVTGTNAADFALSSDTCASGTILNGATCSVTVKVTPTSAPRTNETATYNFTFTGATGSPLTVSLTATSGATANAAPCAACFVAVPLPAQPAPPAILSVSPTQSYVTAKGCSQDGITWSNPCVITLNCTGCSSQTTATFDGKSVTGTYSSGKLTASVPLSLIPVPGTPTQHSFVVSNPAVTVPAIQ